MKISLTSRPSYVTTKGVKKNVWSYVATDGEVTVRGNSFLSKKDARDDATRQLAAKAV